MRIKLQIMMGLNCNFTCGHCLNDSGPGIRHADFSAKDAASVIEAIRLHPQISAIGFSGGEPLLYLEKIQSLLNSIHQVRSLDTLTVSLTSNGALINRFAERISQMKIDQVVLSYDRYHSAFMSPQEFANAVILSKRLFKRVEINLVGGVETDLELVREVALKEDIKVHISQPLRSGRYKPETKLVSETFYKQLSCPNLSGKQSEYFKVSYFPGKGFSLCCGPLIFDAHTAEDILAFGALNDVLESNMLKVLHRTREVPIKTNESLDCNACTNIFKKPAVKRHLEDFHRNSSWSNLYPASEFSQTDLTDLAPLFQPRLIFTAPRNSLVAPDTGSQSHHYRSHLASVLTPEEVQTAAEFTRRSFYNHHSEHISPSDLERFDAQRDDFFALPLQSIRHFDSNGKLVAFLVMGKIEDYPHFKETVWHVGYGGMSSEVQNRGARESIKLDWLALLAKSNKDHRIACAVDYFNNSALRMASKFGGPPIACRLDPRN